MRWLCFWASKRPEIEISPSLKPFSKMQSSVFCCFIMLTKRTKMYRQETHKINFLPQAVITGLNSGLKKQTEKIYAFKIFSSQHCRREVTADSACVFVKTVPSPHFEPPSSLNRVTEKQQADYSRYTGVPGRPPMGSIWVTDALMGR